MRNQPEIVGSEEKQGPRALKRPSGKRDGFEAVSGPGVIEIQYRCLGLDDGACFPASFVCAPAP